MVNWGVFNSNMTLYLSAFVAKDTKSFVEFFLTQFDLAIRTGQTVNGNLLINTNFEFSKQTTLSAMEIQLQLQETFIELQLNIDAIIDYVFESEVGKLLNSPPPSQPSNSNPLIGQAINLATSLVTPIIVNLIKSVGIKDPKKTYTLIKENFNKESIKKQITDKLNPLDKTFDIIASGISLTLLNNGLFPIPPLPPTSLPNFSVPFPCVILFPGDVKGLSKDLKRALSDDALIKTPPLATQLLQLALQKYLMTVGGLYFGMIYVGLGLIPAPPIPWIGIT